MAKRTNPANPTANIIKTLEKCAEELNFAALDLGEYLTTFDGQAKVEVERFVAAIKNTRSLAAHTAIDMRYWRESLFR